MGSPVMWRSPHNALFQSGDRHITHSFSLKRLYGGWSNLFLRDERSRVPKTPP
ncbi:hypothetical protein J0895_24835 [Phormidium pseudopriestleyi FRX01]|uniref:Uncharacterized protein n=1 Tax=Phormidium pseudopriestleyi FRX01 TaxID=1759528 RepID=A0ABS3FYN6_9CYAN|nr:hypothetical protein [Phormidium pseudopriestleyi]MBO0352249.1 hypothetical protein [Phormidium pseudopriestleyi FRX01]